MSRVWQIQSVPGSRDRQSVGMFWRPFQTLNRAGTASQSSKIKINFIAHVFVNRTPISVSCLADLRAHALTDFDLESSAVLHQNRWFRARVGPTIARDIDLDTMERSAPSNTLWSGISWRSYFCQKWDRYSRELELNSLTRGLERIRPKFDQILEISWLRTS